MPSASFNKYTQSAEVLAEAINAGSDTWRIILSNTAPDVSDVAQADAAELSTAGGYTVNGQVAAVSTATGNPYKLVLGSPTGWTGSGAGFTARYAILWNQTQDKLFGWWDYGSSQLVAAGETFDVNLDGSAGTFTLT